MLPNAPREAAGRIFLGLCFLFVTHFTGLMNVCFPSIPAWLLPACYTQSGRWLEEIHYQLALFVRP
jgi:hypothetical protein